MIAPPLSPEEFASLLKVVAGPLGKGVVPAEHLLKLVGYRYILQRDGQYEPTVTGLIRINAGR